MRLSRNGIIALINEEALVLSAYQDSVGIWTLGVGHTAAVGGIIPKRGMKISIEDAITLLKSDILKFEKHVTTALKGKVVAQCEFDALMLFDFNTGAIISGSVDDKLAAGHVDAAMKTLQAYDKAGGKKSKGLDKRRDREEAMFRHGLYVNTKTITVYDKWPGKGRVVPVDSIRF